MSLIKRIISTAALSTLCMYIAYGQTSELKYMNKTYSYQGSTYSYNELGKELPMNNEEYILFQNIDRRHRAAAGWGTVCGIAAVTSVLAGVGLSSSNSSSGLGSLVEAIFYGAVLLVTVPTTAISGIITLITINRKKSAINTFIRSYNSSADKGVNIKLSPTASGFGLVINF